MEEFITVKKVEGVNVINFVFNEINLEQRESIKNELAGLVRQGETEFVLDLSRVGFISSLVIATIVFFAKEARNSGGEVKLSGLTNDAYSIFQLTQLDKIFELYETETDAVESFRNS